MSSDNRKKLSTTVYLTQEQTDALKALSDETKVPAAEFIRQGVDLIIAQRRAKPLPRAETHPDEVEP